MGRPAYGERTTVLLRLRPTELEAIEAVDIASNRHDTILRLIELGLAAVAAGATDKEPDDGQQ